MINNYEYDENNKELDNNIDKDNIVDYVCRLYDE